MKLQSIEIPPDEISFDFIRASGPGGQNVNKVATAVQLRFDAMKTKILSPEVRDRLLKLAGKRASASGEIIIEARRHRTQLRNREDAMERLEALIARAAVPPVVRHRSRPTQAARIKRLNEKKRHSAVKKLRSRIPAETSVD